MLRFLMLSPLFWIIAICGGCPAVQFWRCQRAAEPFERVGGHVQDSADGASRLTGPRGLFGVVLIGKQITDDTLKELRPAFRRLPSCERLVLEDTSVTDVGLSYLDDVVQLSYLDVSGSSVTATGLNQFKGIDVRRPFLIVGDHFTDDEVAELSWRFRVLRVGD
jgi:hypothetical protein